MTELGICYLIIMGLGVLCAMLGAMFITAYRCIRQQEQEIRIFNESLKCETEQKEVIE